MVRAAPLIALFLLTGCNSDIASTPERAAVADANARTALMRNADLQDRLEKLESELKAQKNLIDAYAASLDEARNNHSALLKTFNENVDKSNRRDTAQERDIDWLLRRNGVPR